MSRWARAWNDWFFPSFAPARLGVCRVLFFGYLLVNYGTRSFDAWAAVPASFWMPTPLFRWLEPAWLTGGLLLALQWLWRVALAASFLGIRTRWANAFSFLLGAFLIGLPHGFGKVHHNDALLVFVLALMAFARAGDAWSLDAWLGGRRERDPGPEYGWPVRMACTLILVVYFGAGVAKLRVSGASWVLSDNMRNLLVAHHYGGHHPPVDWGLALARVPWVPRLAAGTALLAELAAPLAIVSRRARAVVVPALFLLQAGIWLLMGVAFREFLFLYVFWVPWERWFAGRAPAAARSPGTA